MRELKACTQNEIRKVLSQKKYWVLPILTAVIIGVISLARLLPSNIILSMDNYPFTVLSVLTYVALPVIAFMLAADLMAGEEERNELKIALLQPVKRISVLGGKLVAMVLYSGIFLLGMSLVALIVSLPWAGLSIAGFGTLMLAVLLSMLPIAMVSALAMLASTFAKTSTASFIICLLVYIGIGAIGFFLPSLSMALPTGYMAIYKMILGSYIPWSSLGVGAAILAGYAILFTSAAGMRFEKKEV